MFTWVMTAVVIICTSVVTYWAQDRRPPVQILEETVETPYVSTGDFLRVRYAINREKICRVHLEQFLFDSKRGRFSVGQDQDFTVAPGEAGRDEFVSVVSIPQGFLSGPARYRAIRAYYCNPIHNWLQWPVIVVAPDVTFEVLETSNARTDYQRPKSQERLGASGTPGVSGESDGVQEEHR